MLMLDRIPVRITDQIIESSDIGFSLGTENHLIILPSEVLSGSLLLSSGSRLDHDLLLSFADEKRAKGVKLSLEKIFPKEVLRIRTYEERSERNLETIEELTNYILLILVVSSIFTLVILRSAHDSFFERLSQTLRIIEILGFTRKRQMILFTILYVLILPLSLIIAGGMSYGGIYFLSSIPEAANFEWKWGAFSRACGLLGLLILAGFYGAWRERWIAPLLTPSSNTDTIPSSLLQDIRQRIYHRSEWIRWITSIGFVYFLIGSSILVIIFENIFFAIGIVAGVSLAGILIAWGLRWIYRFLFGYISFLRRPYFAWYDGIRTLVRPLTPTIPITLSLISITTFLLVFILFSLAFRSELSIDSEESANVYALNILESDRKKIETIITPKDEFYSILRARISRINNKPLEEHLGSDRPSGEFTREFNLTDTPLENPILRGKPTIGTQEVSVDDAFAERLGVDIGDSIEFLLSGKRIILTIANIRESTRQGFRPFFYFSVDPEAFRNAPKTYFLSTYSNDIEAWKKRVLEHSGTHVTFIDVENILTIVRSISEKVLAIIGLFLTIISIFSAFAIASFFARMQRIESMKQKLYPLFGMNTTTLRNSLRISRSMLFVISWILSSILGSLIALALFRSSSILSFSLGTTLLVLLVSILVYILFALILQPRGESLYSEK